MIQSIVFAGTPENAAQTLGAMVAGGIEVSLVVTRNDARSGRKGTLTESAVAIKARALGLEIFKTNKLDDEAVARIRATGSEIGIVVAYGSIFDGSALGSLSKGWFNLHYSLLPLLRGAAPVQQAIIQQFSETGITLFKLDQGVDTGPMVSQLQTRIERGETAGILLRRLTELGSSLLLQEIPTLIAGTMILKQQVGEVSIASKISRDDARLHFTQDARNLEALVLGCNPEPGAWAMLDEQVFKVHDGFAVQSDFDGESGLVFKHGANIAVKCEGTSALVLTQVQPAGKSTMTAADWHRGRTQQVRLT